MAIAKIQQSSTVFPFERWTMLKSGVLSSSSCLQLISCHILEVSTNTKDDSANIFWTWSYPSLSTSNRAAYTKKCRIFLTESQSTSAGNQFFHQGDHWVYIHLLSTELVGIGVTAGIVVCAADFNPERYETLSRSFGVMYNSSEFKPASILHAFLSVQTTGKFTTAENDVFYFHEYDTYDFFRQPKLRGIIETFGVEIILVYTCLLLKKRMIVYHHDVSKLYELILSLPAFVQHRPNIWQAIYPLVENSEKELESFQGSHFHVLGCTKALNRTDLYDLYVNAPATEIMVAPHARDTLTMTKTHKDIAIFMQQLCEKKSLTERDIMQEVSKKTHELLENLRMFSTLEEGRSTFSLKEMRSREFSPTLESFLVALAQAEDITLLR